MRRMSGLRKQSPHIKRHRADRIVAEANQGGAMVESTIRAVDANVPIKLVHASRGKITRAEPISALYEQGRVSHVGGFPELEDEMCSAIEPGSSKSPDRMDALVWALTELMIGPSLGDTRSLRSPAQRWARAATKSLRVGGDISVPYASAPPGGWPCGSPERRLRRLSRI